MSKSEFARRQLKKHGWKEGSGLGKEEHGRADPIKVSLKMDKTGVGHDPGKEFTDHWWLRVFNEAAQKIGKKSKGNGSTVPQSKEEEAKSKKEQQRKNFYKGFVQSATLTNGIEEKIVSSDSSDEDEKDTSEAVSVPTLEDIHKFCGGATGHKAASFGIRMEGKIKRASHHEKQFEEKTKKNELNDEISINTPDISSYDCGTAEKKHKKKKKRKEERDQEVGNSSSSEPSVTDNKKKLKRKLEDVGVEIETKHEDLDAKPSKKSKKKKKNKIERSIIDSQVTNENDESARYLDGSCDSEIRKEEPNGYNGLEVEESENKGCKKKKKKKKNHD